jgi:transposase InsO family protein
VENIDHSRTKARHPQTNGICERFHRTLQEEFYATAFRKKLYHGLEELLADLDQWMRGPYHQGAFFAPVRLGPSRKATISSE